MQGQRNATGALPENLLFGDGSASGDSLVGPTQMPWNNDHNDSTTYEQNRARQALPSNHNGVHFVQHSGLYYPNTEWFSGESSSNASQHQVNIGVRKPEDSWNFSSNGVLSFENRQYEPSNSTALSLDNNAELNASRNPTFTLMGLPFPPTRNMSLGFGNNGDCPEVGWAKPSFDGQAHPSFCSSSENRGKSQKRKALDFNMGQSSNSGNEVSQWRAQVGSDNANASLQTENGDMIIGNSASDPTTLSQRLAIGGQEISRRNLRLGVDGSAHLLPRQSMYSDVRTVASNLPSNHSSRSLQDSFLGSNQTATEAEMANHLHIQPAPFRLPNVHRNLTLPSIRRLGSSSSSSSSSPSYHHPMPEERVPPVLEPSSSRNIPEHPMSQNPAPFLNSRNMGLASSSRAPRLTTVLNPSETNHLSRANTQRPRRLSDVIRRPLLASSRVELGGQNGPRSSPSGLDGLSHRARAVLLDRHPNSTLGLPRSLRTLGTAAAATEEGRSNSMPEHVRRILDIMRRSDGLRFEDMMILDHPAFYAMADMHDRHRDMRMDVDNMSYEELLALEERIGNVCTGLSEERIMKHMKQRKYANDFSQDQDEPCSICREEYSEGEDMGKLECGHDFHRDCIKQWLKEKNLCPICKTTGLST